MADKDDSTITDASADLVIGTDKVFGKVGANSRYIDPQYILGATHKCRAYRTAAATLTGDGASHKLPIDTADFNPNSILDTGNNRITPTAGGVYLVEAAVCITTPRTLWAYLYKNGAVEARGSFLATSGYYMQASALIEFNGSTDYVELWGGVNSGTNPSLQVGRTGCRLSVLGPF